MNSYMNTYLFIATERKGPPVLEYIVQARTPEEAIKQVNYYPFDMGEEFLDGDGVAMETVQERIDTVFRYYGLMDSTVHYNGNGIDGYGTQLIEVSNNGTIGKVMGNVASDQKEVQTEPAVYDPTPVSGYSDGIIRSNRKPMYRVEETPGGPNGNYWFHIDGLYYNVHPYQHRLGGYPVRWLQDCEPGS